MAVLLVTRYGFMIGLAASALVTVSMWLWLLGSGFGKFHAARSTEEMKTLILGKESVQQAMDAIIKEKLSYHRDTL